MSNKKTNESTEPKQPAYVEDLLKNGTVVLNANTRDELADMVNGIPANVRYGAGAAGYNPETGAFTLRVDILND
jgi:hypothetical protein